MTISDQQLAFFETFGCLRLPGLYADRVDAVIESFGQVWDGRGGGHDGRAHDNRRRSTIVPFIDQHPGLCALLDDPRIHDVACRLLGDDFNYMGSDGNYYAGDTGWHSDGFAKTPGIRHIKLAFYLDPLTPETGALRVIPGSHHERDDYARRLDQALGRGGSFGLRGDETPHLSWTIRPGDLVIFDHSIKHASFGGGSNRRMFTINLCQRFPAERLADLHRYIDEFARFWVDRVYGETMVSTAGPQRQRHLEQVLANDGHLAELSRRARERMAEPSRG